MKHNALYVQQLPYTRCLLFACGNGLLFPTFKARAILLFMDVLHSFYSTILSLASSFTAGEDLLG